MLAEDEKSYKNSESRKTMYKSTGLDSEECRRRRRDEEVRIRKQKRTDILDNRRRVQQLNYQNFDQSTIPTNVVDQLKSEVLSNEANAIKFIGEKLFSGTVALEDITMHGVLSTLSEIYFNRYKNLSIKSSIRKILNRCAQTEESSSSNDEDCIKSLCLILSKNEESTYTTSDGLQSISVFLGVNVAFRNIAFDMAIVPSLLNAYYKRDERVRRHVMWLVSQLFHKIYDYSPCVEEVVPLLEIVADGMKSEDNVIQCDAVRACALMAEWPDIWEEMRTNKLLPLLVHSLSSGVGVARPSVLRAIDFIIESTSAFTNDLVECGLLDVLRPLIIVRYLAHDVCFILSNISSEENMIGGIISAGILTELAKIMEFADYSTRKEAAFTICHCCLTTNAEHLEAVLQCGVLGAFTDLLTVMDPSLVLEVLDALERLLSYGEKDLSREYSNPVASKLEELKAKEKLEFLTESQNIDIHIRAYGLLERYFDEDELVGLRNCASQVRTTVDASIESVLSAVTARDA